MKNILEHFLSLIEVPYTKKYADTLYYEHPCRYNMYGLKRMLDVYGVKTMGVNIPSKDLAQLNYPCILHTRNDFTIGIDCDADTITYLQHGKERRTPHDEFLQTWSGNALVISETTEAVEPHYRKNKHNELLEKCKTYSIPLILVLTSLLGIIHNTSSINSLTIARLLLSSIGVYICLLLIQKQVMGQSRYGDKVCSLFHYSDCNNILDGPKSKVFGISWSEIGLGYFIANTLLMSLYPSSQGFVSVVTWVAMCFGIWSIYYQWHVAKSWCLLCVIVQIIIWIIGGTFVASCVMSPIEVFSTGSLMSASVYAISIMAVHQYAVYANTEEERIQTVQKYRAIKTNSDVAKVLITKGEYHKTTLEDSSILFGNPQADMRITILSNPHCNPCAKMHTRVDELLGIYGDEICIQYILSSFNKELEDSNRYLISCYNQADKEESWKAFSEWYEHHKYHYEEVVSEHREDLYSDFINDEMERHVKWMERTGIVATPTILVNGYILPKEYAIEDLPMIINVDY